MVLHYTRNSRYLLLSLLGSTLACFSYLIFICNPLELIIEKITAFHSNSIVFGMWKEPPFDILLKVYLFNVTNPDEFIDGSEKLKLQEIGPYVYKEEMYNENITFNDNGTVSFTPKRKLKFVRELSIGDPSVDILLLPNIPLLGITAALVDQSMFVQIGVSSISAYLGSQPFINLTINDYLYGYDDPLVTLANDYIPSWIDFSRFGILDRIMNLDNDSSIVTINTKSDIKTFDDGLTQEGELKEQFSILKWNGSPGLNQWGYKIPKENETVISNSECNLVEGCYIGTIFPRNIKINSTFRLYRQAFCRPIPIHFEEIVTTKDGFEGYLYKVEQDFLANAEENSKNECYCQSEECVPKGLGDLSPCYYGIPISMSQPHFLNGDPKLLESVDGLHPDKDKHEITMTIQPQLGVPLEASLRVQINLLMPTTYYNSKTKPFNNLAVPLFWVDLGIGEVPSLIRLAITLFYSVLPIVQDVFMYLFAISGTGLILGSALVFVISNKPDNRQKSFHVNYSQIPVFALKTKIFKPDVLIEK